MADNKASTPVASSLPRKQQATLNKWLEPPLPVPVPSYQDNPTLNIPPFGVLSNMAPLGTSPGSKMQKIAQPVVPVQNGGGSLSSVSTPADGTMTPDHISKPNSMRMSDLHREEGSAYHPATPPTVRGSTAPSTAVNGALLPPGLQRMASQPAHTPLPMRQPFSGPPPTSTSSMFATSTNMVRPEKSIREVALSAIRRARGAGREPTAFALFDLIVHPSSDANVERVFRAVASAGSRENIPPEIWVEFEAMVHQKKRENRQKGLPAGSFYGAGVPRPVRFATPSYDTPPKNAPAIPDSLPEQASGSLSRSSSKLPSISPSKEYAHVSKKLKSANFEHQHPTTVSNPVLDTTNGSSAQPTMSDASRSSSPLSELEDDHELLLENLDFAPPHLFAPPDPEDEPVAPSYAESKARGRTASRRKGAPRLQTSLANSSAVAASPSPLSAIFPATANKSHKKTPSNVKQMKLDPNDAREMMRKKAREITQNISFSQSEVRTSLNSVEIDSDTEEADSIATSRPPPKGPQRLRLRHNVPKGPANEDSDKSSPTFLPFQHELAPPSSTASRQSTPNAYGRPSRKAKTGPKVKSSPMKNRAAPLAGISRASGERNSPVGNGGFGSTQDDNHDDYCSSCGGGGTIVCCDGEGCRRSYHWLCLDPPRREEDVESTESVYCCACTASMRLFTRRPHTLFSSLLQDVERKNPVAFRLSKDVSEYFEGVKTGPQGEYEDILPVKEKHKNRAGYEEAPDYLRLKDGKGNTILCHKCSRSAASGQPIIGCSFCPLQWHLDCLDPPLANPPSISRCWKCPCHVEELLEKMPGMLGPAHKFRKIKGAPAMRPPRSVRNNGHIEIENMPSGDDEDAQGFYNQNSFGREYRLPENGVKLDFITRVQKERREDSRKRQREAEDLYPMSRIGLRPIHEQQAALNLGLLANSPTDFGNLDQVPQVIAQLLAQAPDDVVRLIAQADASRIATRKVEEVVKLRITLASLLANADSCLKKAQEVDENIKLQPASNAASPMSASMPTPTSTTNGIGEPGDGSGEHGNSSGQDMVHSSEVDSAKEQIVEQVAEGQVDEAPVDTAKIVKEITAGQVESTPVVTVKQHVVDKGQMEIAPKNEAAGEHDNKEVIAGRDGGNDSDTEMMLL